MPAPASSFHSVSAASARLAVLLAGLLLLGCGKDPAPTAPATKESAASEYLSTHDFGLFLPDTLVDTASAHDARITRVYATAEEEVMLRTAESLYPPSARQADDSGAPVDRWWFDEFDGIMINNQVTRGALEYYLATIRRFQAGDFAGTIPMQSSGLRFHSSIRWEDSIVEGGRAYHAVYVAEIELSWYQVCGNLCAMGFSRKRTVILNNAGQWIRVIEPTGVSYWVS